MWHTSGEKRTCASIHCTLHKFQSRPSELRIEVTVVFTVIVHLNKYKCVCMYVICGKVDCSTRYRCFAFLWLSTINSCGWYSARCKYFFKGICVCARYKRLFIELVALATLNKTHDCSIYRNSNTKHSKISHNKWQGCMNKSHIHPAAYPVYAKEYNKNCGKMLLATCT